jgi:hypothetical protein
MATHNIRQEIYTQNFWRIPFNERINVEERFKRLSPETKVAVI